MVIEDMGKLSIEETVSLILNEPKAYANIVRLMKYSDCYDED